MIPRLDAFAARLRSAREKMGLDQTQFGALGGVSRGAQSNYEKGARAPDVEYLLRIAEHGVDVAHLLSGQVASQTLPPEIASAATVLAQMNEEAQWSFVNLIKTISGPLALAQKYAGKDPAAAKHMMLKDWGEAMQKGGSAEAMAGFFDDGGKEASGE